MSKSSLLSASRTARIAAAALMLAAALPASSAISAEHRVRGHASQMEAQVPAPRTRALYGANAGDAFPGAADQSNDCVGGYRWVRHFYDANRTAAEDEVPLPCR